uniref:Olfactory receptor n=1 Tax=Ornithorhynchus anatinus TaxID=9258 RepID=F7FK14_ORNAN
MLAMRNNSLGEHFILMGFSDQPQLELILFVVVLTSYLLTLVGNTIIIVVSRLDPRLQTPLYFFLSHLSLVDLCFTTSIVPQLLWNLWGPSKAITVVGCAIQLYVSLALGSAECILLPIMAFDRYTAVCRPLHYRSIMHPRFCHALAAVAWTIGLGNSVIQSTITLRLPRCGHRHLAHFICEVPALIKLACVDQKPMRSCSSWPLWSCSFSLGTCGSHLLVVTLFFGMSSIIYIQPNSSFSKTSGKFLTLFYTVVTPTLNPIIYTLRNKVMLGAVRRLLWKDCRSTKT